MIRRRTFRPSLRPILLAMVGACVAAPLGAQMNVGVQPPPPPPRAYPSHVYPYPCGLPLRRKKKEDRCAKLETPYERNMCEDESTSGTKARCGTGETPCSN